MLTSSDAKFRCMWHMVVWSLMLMVVSQFFQLTDHIAFYIFASAAMLLLPLITSIYSNTAGRHGAGLLRVSYIFCDPVLACITVIPVLLINRLPLLVNDYLCLDQTFAAVNETVCNNRSLIASAVVHKHAMVDLYSDLSRNILKEKVRIHIGMIQASLVAPPLLTLAMGRRTRKMAFSTIVGVASYWLVICIETADLVSVEVITRAAIRPQAIISTASVIAIVSILTNSYAVVTLCSYICPMDRHEDSETRRFDTLYRFLVGAIGVLFAEIPLLATRGQVMGATNSLPPLPLPTVFYIWTVKDIIFIVIAIMGVGVYVVGARRDFVTSSCGRLTFDNPDVFFVPEKRDLYIVQHKSELHHPIKRVSDSCDNASEITAHRHGSDGRKKKRVTFRLDGSHSKLPTHVEEVSEEEKVVSDEKVHDTFV